MMIIKRIKIKNFKQFYGENEIVFDTHNKITVIYGYNSHGKSRLLSFLLWLFYEENTLNEKLYNIPANESSFVGDEIEVYGEIEFSRDGVDYLFSRMNTFKKQKFNTTFTEDRTMLYEIQKSGNHKFIDDGKNFISTVIPKELSKYFFFDGEGMTAELIDKKGNKKSSDLKKVINKLFGLELFENAIMDIGTRNRKNNAIYKLSTLYKDSGGYTPNQLAKVIAAKGTEIEALDGKITELLEEVDEKAERITELSEIIGKATASINMNNERSLLVKNSEMIKNEINKTLKMTGSIMTNQVIYLLLARKIVNAQDSLVEKVKVHYVPGLDRKLVENLLHEDNCICGNSIGDSEKEVLRSVLELLPPNSYETIYKDYKDDATGYIRSSDLTLEKLKNILVKVNDGYSILRKNNRRIDEIDQELAISEDMGQIINERNSIEKELKNINEKIGKKKDELAREKVILVSAERQLKSAVRNSSYNKSIDEKIQYMENLGKEISKRLEKKRSVYHSTLQKNIKDLASKMMSIEREIVLENDYSITVRDTFNNTALGAGHSAVACFAYIGGILRSLKELDVEYVTKDYPLIMDAPLSHLDGEHIKRVFDTLPEFSNQVIIFSKECIDENVHIDDNFKYQINSNLANNMADLRKYVGKKYFDNDSSYRRLSE